MKSIKRVRNKKNRTIRFSKIKSVGGGDTLIKRKREEDLLDILNKETLSLSVDEIVDIIENGYDINARNNNGETPLYLAIFHHHSEVALILMDKGADINAVNNDGYTPLHVICEDADVDAKVAKKLMEKKPYVNVREKNGNMPLHFLLQGEDALNTVGTEICRKLIENGADIDAYNHDGVRPLHLALKNGHLDFAIKMIDNGCNINAGNDNGDTPLQIALKHNHLEIAIKLIEKGSLINTRNDEGGTPLHTALFYEHSEIALTLIDEGANINAKDGQGFTPLHIASQQDLSQLVRVLLRLGADMNARNMYGDTPLHTACVDSEIAIVMALIDKGSNVNAHSDDDGGTPLHRACKSDNSVVAFVLIKRGAEVNSRDNDGNTPLHIACKKHNVKVGKILIKNGSDVNIENKFGEVPSNYIDPRDYEKYGFDEKLINRLLKDGVYELRKYKGVLVPIMVIPRGTLLFRTIQEGSDDFCGIPNGDKYCLNKNHNVFFYPYPAYWGDTFKIFVVEKTLRVVNLISPSYLSREMRLSKYSKYDFIRSCHIVEPDFCKGEKGRDFDPCLSEGFLIDNPDVAGMIALAIGDLDSHSQDYRNLNDYSLLHRDVRGEVGVPEIILHPKQNRINKRSWLRGKIKDQYWSVQDCIKEVSNYSYLIDETNYHLDMVNLLLSPKGYNINSSGSRSLFAQKNFDTINVTLYNPLKMYVVWEYLEEKYKKDCVPINWTVESKLSQFQSDVNKLNKEVYNRVTTLKNILDTHSSGGKLKKKKPRRNKTRKKSNK